MANILLTQRCTRSCPYCFAKKHMAGSPPDDILSWEDLIYLVDFLQLSGETRVQFLGGEPTLHPDFIDFCLYVLRRGMGVTVFTNGMLLPDKLSDAVRRFSGIREDRLSFVCNLNHPEHTPKSESVLVADFLEAFGRRITPGFNIYRNDFDIDFLFDYINRYGLGKGIRLGLAHPIPGTRNMHIKIADMAITVRRLMSFRDKFERHRVRPLPDCGFPMCHFTTEDKGWLYRMTGGRFQFGCSPVIDIGPDMSVWSCFPLSAHHKKSIFEFDSMRDVFDFYHERHRSIRVEVGGIFGECDDCRFREDDICMGGCAAHALSAFVNEANVRLPEFYQ
ncbi:MAG: radical SAM protein [Nitrospirae bacterium]|nr:radical SAM protein [Nitrospirota bacterium]